MANGNRRCGQVWLIWGRGRLARWSRDSRARRPRPQRGRAIPPQQTIQRLGRLVLRRRIRLYRKSTTCQTVSQITYLRNPNSVALQVPRVIAENLRRTSKCQDPAVWSERKDAVDEGH